jgi:hypothetical protein
MTKQTLKPVDVKLTKGINNKFGIKCRFMIFEPLLSLMINVGVVVVHICYTLIVVKVIFTLLFIQLP